MKRLREWLESIVFAGLKPSRQPNQAAPAATGSIGRLRERIDKFISGGPPPTDPLYLTNRSLGQKLRSGAVIAVPLLILIGGVALTLGRYLVPPEAKPVADLTPSEVAAKVLPNMSAKDLKIDSNRSLDVVEARIERSGGVRMVGIVKNLTDHEIAAAEIGCDLTDDNGTQLGAVSVHVEKIPASGTKRFELSLKQAQASFVLIREISTR